MTLMPWAIIVWALEICSSTLADSCTDSSTLGFFLASACIASTICLTAGLEKLPVTAPIRTFSVPPAPPSSSPRLQPAATRAIPTSKTNPKRARARPILDLPRLCMWPVHVRDHRSHPGTSQRAESRPSRRGQGSKAKSLARGTRLLRPTRRRTTLVSTMTTVDLAYGRSGLTVDLPGGADVIEPRQQPGSPTRPRRSGAPCAEPLAGPPLGELVRRGASVAVVVCDVTRPFPAARVLPVLLEELDPLRPGAVEHLRRHGHPSAVHGGGARADARPRGPRALSGRPARRLRPGTPPSPRDRPRARPSPRWSRPPSSTRTCASPPASSSRTSSPASRADPRWSRQAWRRSRPCSTCTRRRASATTGRPGA